MEGQTLRAMSDRLAGWIIYTDTKLVISGISVN